jgi:type II secretion system protein D
MDFLRFLSSYTGLPLLHDSTDQNIARDITIAADIQEADEDLVKAILEVNRFRVFRETLPSGKEVLKVESMMPAAAPGAEDAKETQILDLRGGVEKAPEQPPSPDEFATMVFELKYTAPRDASEALNNLVGSATGRVGPAGAAAGGGRSGTKSFNMVEVKNTQMLIITAKFGLLNYIKKLLQLIDVPVREPERQIHIIEVEEADPEELVSIINEFLGQGMGGGARGGLGRSRLGGASRLGQPTQGATPPVPGQVGGLQGQNEYRTNLIPDARTNKIIVETYSPQDYHDIQMLIGELDIRFDLKRLRTHIYQVRYLKAVEVAADLQSLLAGSAGGGLSGLRRSAGGSTGAARSTGGRFASRRSTARSGPLGAPGGPGATTPGGAGGGANAPIPSLIVPHEPTNSLLIQAEPEEFDEIQNVLSKIDTKRRQVFLEAALVQVQSQSALNYTIELIAGNPDDVATRALFASSFGLTGIDFDNFERTVPDLSDPAAVPPGGLAAIMHRGKLPAIVRFFKSNRDSQILATPFVLADDNMENAIEILETRFVVNTATVNTSTTSSQQGEPAGITLALTPTISGSERAVFLEMELTVSEFQEAAAAAQPTLPPKNENKMTSSVTIPDGEVFVVGGLTRQNKSKAVSKVPIIGDIPIIGKLFRSESTVQNQNNLYIFLQAHILTDEEFRDGQELTGQAEDKMHTFDPSLKPTQFEKPQTPRKAQAIDEDAQRTFNLNESGDEFYRGRHRRSGTATRGKAAGGAEGSAGPPSARVRNQENTTSGQKQPTTRDGWLLAPAGGETEYQDQGEE